MQGERILIVEDERIIAFDLQRRLQGFGLEVVGTCSTGVEALEAAAAERPDLALMDISLEGDGPDGIETAQLLLSRYQIPSIFLTSYSDPATLERAKAAQPLAYLIKPYKERELYTTIDVALFKNRSDAKIRDQDRWLSAILNSVSDALLALTPNLDVHYANPAAAALLGIAPSELSGRPLPSLFQLLDEETLSPLPLFEHDDGEATVFFRQTLMQTAEGHVHHVEGSLSRVRFDRLPVGRVLTLRDVSSVRKLSERLEFQSKHDALTGLSNRKEFTALLSEVHQKKAVAGLPCAMLYLDLDQFKLVNDTCGHLAGDELLRQTADILRQTLDQTATLLARLGGDEFALVLENCTLDQALERAWVVKHKLNAHEFTWQSTAFKVKASMGLVALGGGFEDVKTVLAAADDACYLAKEEGGNKIKVYSGEEDAFRKRRGEMTWISRLNKALEEDRFVLYFQTIEALDAGAGLRPKVEVLLRLRDDQDKIIPPSDFIPAAERYNLMPQIDRWVVRNAVARYEEFAGKHALRPVMCLNLSGESVADPNLIAYLRHEFKRSNADPRDFCFEITETATIGSMGRAITLIQDLKAMGSSFALDDFGSGLSSFGYLRALPVDYLKIDGVFVKNIDVDPVNYAMVEGIQKISRVMGLKTIAEFAATDAVLATLRTIGIDYAQGYALSRPEPL